MASIPKRVRDSLDRAEALLDLKQERDAELQRLAALAKVAPDAKTRGKLSRAMTAARELYKAKAKAVRLRYKAARLAEHARAQLKRLKA